jgi:hypothetical protein
MANSRFSSTYNRGFQLAFANGYEISVQWGAGNYGSRRDLARDLLADLDSSTTEARTAEVLVTAPDGSDVRLEGDDGHGCLGWQTADQVAALIARFAGGAV